MTDIREATMFKAVPGGYVFRAPNPWAFGRYRFYRVNEAQKSELLSIIKARSPVLFWIALVVLIVGSTALPALGTGHDNPTFGDIIIMLALIPVSIYAAMLIVVRPMASRMEPILAGLPRTEERITPAELRQVMRGTVSVPQGFLLGTIQTLLAASFVVLAFLRLRGGRVSVFEDASGVLYAFAAAAFAFAAASFFVAAIRKARETCAAGAQGGTPGDNAPATASFKSYLLPIFSLVVSIAVFGFVVTTAIQRHDREQRTAAVQSRLDNLKLRTDGARIRSRQEDLKVRAAANSARVTELAARLNNPTVKCETADDPALPGGLAACRERARKEQDVIRVEMAAAVKETGAIKIENEALQAEIDAERREIDAIQKEIDANRR
jgi:hypothetical protein